MKLLEFNESDNGHGSDYPEDVERLQRAAALNGCVLPKAVAVRVWEAYSDTYAAGWLLMDSYPDSSLWDIIQQYTK